MLNRIFNLIQYVGENIEIKYAPMIDTYWKRSIKNIIVNVIIKN